MTNTGISVWRVSPQLLTAHLHTPGVDQVRVEQKGREVHVTGCNDNYGVRYSYVLPLHPDSRDNVSYTYHQGLVVITTDNINSVSTVLPTTSSNSNVPAVASMRPL